MSETLIQTPNIRKSKINMIVAPLTALAIAGTLGLAMKKGTDPEKAFKTDIPVPTEAQPHIDYTVHAGDTESSISDKFNVRFDGVEYQNMINLQIPKADQSGRMLQPGEQLNLPPK
jgi:LysM repeat protein